MIVRFSETITGKERVLNVEFDVKTALQQLKRLAKYGEISNVVFEKLPYSCPYCGGFTYYFKETYQCRDCGETIAVFKDGKWILPISDEQAKP